MASNPTTSIDAALDYARVAVGDKKAAELLRAAAFDDTIRDERTLRPQLASALVRAVHRYRTEAA
jgi:hypothetical protein